MNYKEYLTIRLKEYTIDQIIFSKHAIIRLEQRQIKKSDIMENILNPERLDYAIRVEPKNIGEEKFDCYFGYSKTLCHRYILMLKDDVIIITVIKINRRWQSLAEKRTKSYSYGDKR